MAKLNLTKIEDEDVANLPADAANSATALAAYGHDAGTGLEDVGMNEMLVPFYRVLQPLSKAVQDDPNTFKPGMIHNTATGETYTALGFIPAARDHNFTKWTPLDKGGGFKGLFGPGDPYIEACKARADEQFAQKQRRFDSRFGKLPCDDGDELVESYYLYGLFLDPAMPVPMRGVINFSSSQVKKYQSLMMRLLGLQLTTPDGRSIKLPIWAHTWKLTTVTESNKAGQKYFGWKIDFANGSQAASLMAPNNPLYQQAKEFHELQKHGVVQAAYDTLKAEDEADPNAPGM